MLLFRYRQDRQRRRYRRHLTQFFFKLPTSLAKAKEFSPYNIKFTIVLKELVFFNDNVLGNANLKNTRCVLIIEMLLHYYRSEFKT